MLKESKTAEYKAEYAESLKKTVVAFANTDGGDLYIGILDDGTVAGLPSPEATLLQVTNAIRDSVRPDVTMFVESSIYSIEGRDIVRVTVQRGTARPYYLSGKGIRPEGVYVRQGAASVPATESAILLMIRETSGDNYEQARSLNQQLTFDAAKQAFEAKGLPFTEAQQRTLGIIGGDGAYTNLGLLLSDQCLHTIKLAVYEGGLKAVFKDRREVGGSLLKQLEEAYAFIDMYNRTTAQFVGLSRHDKRGYPPEALREALLNSVTHRDYAFSDATLISLFDDRMEFVTIGGLVKGITFDDIMLGVSVLRNRQLANVFYRLGLIEAYGTGIMKIKNAYLGAARQPDFAATDNAFRLTLPILDTSEGQLPQRDEEPSVDAQDRQKAVLALLDVQQRVSRKDVQEMLGISQSSALLLLRQMMQEGIIVKENSGKNTLYRRKRRTAK